MDRVALGLPCLARGGEHGGFASAGETDNGRDTLPAGDMLDRRPLLVRKPGGSIAGAALNGGVLGGYGAIDMPAIDAMIARLVHTLGRRDHAGFDLDHFPRRISRKLDLARSLVDAFRLKLDQRRRCHDLRERALELLRVVVDVAMQRPRNIVTVEHALFVRDEGKHLLGLLPDQLGVAPGRVLVQPRPRHVEAAPLHLRGMDTHMLGRRDLKPALKVRTMVDPNIQPGPRQVLVRDHLPRLANVAELHVGGRKVVRQQPFVLPLDIGLLA